MAYELYTIRQFESAMFKDDRSVMSNEIYKTVYDEYVDTAQLYEEEEFYKVGYIQNLHGRTTTIEIAIRLQREFIANFQVPYLPKLYIFSNKGYSVQWRKDVDGFLKTLDRVEKSERRYLGELEICIKELVDFRAKKNSKEQPVKIKREQFRRTIISLRKNGFQIDQDKETVEDLALIIKSQKEINKL